MVLSVRMVVAVWKVCGCSRSDFAAHSSLSPHKRDVRVNVNEGCVEDTHIHACLRESILLDEINTSSYASVLLYFHAAREYVFNVHRAVCNSIVPAYVRAHKFHYSIKSPAHKPSGAESAARAVFVS